MLGGTPNGATPGDISFEVSGQNATTVSDDTDGYSLTVTASPRWNLQKGLYRSYTGMTYVANSFTCEARGTSVTSVCTYDVAENRVRWEGDIAPDPGGTNEDDSLNEVALVYRTTVPTEMKTVENQARAHWDANGDGDFSDDITGGQEPVVTDNDTINGEDQTVWTRTEKAEEDGSIGNYIWLDKDGDGKQDKDEKGLENIHVKLIWAGPDNEFGTDDDYTWKTKTNKHGKYKFDNLPKGKFKVIVKKHDVRHFVETYEKGGNLNNKIKLTLREGQDYTKADFGYNNIEEKLAKTGENWYKIIWEIVKSSEIF